MEFLLDVPPNKKPWEERSSHGNTGKDIRCQFRAGHALMQNCECKVMGFLSFCIFLFFAVQQPDGIQHTQHGDTGIREDCQPHGGVAEQGKDHDQ